MVAGAIYEHGQQDWKEQLIRTEINRKAPSKESLNKAA
jgi:hypothetical protein